jgi:hypothetical protein
VNLLHTELEIRSRNEDVADVRQAFRAFLMFHVGGGNLIGDCVIRSCGRRNKILVSPWCVITWVWLMPYHKIVRTLIEGLLECPRGDGCNFALLLKMALGYGIEKDKF